MNYDNRTIGRYPPRNRQQSVERWADGAGDEGALLYWFDGKSVSPIGGRRMGAFTGSPFSSLDRKSKLRHNDYDYAQAFLASEFAYRCISIVAADVDGIHHGVRAVDSKTDAPTHPLARALVYARQMYQQNIISLWQKALGVFGEAYIQPVPNAFGFYSGLRWLNPQAIEPFILHGEITRFDYRAEGVNVPFRPNQLVFDKVDSLLDDLRGQSKIAVALDAINVDREIKRYTLDTLLKDMRMAGILTGRQGSGLSQTDLDTVVTKLREQKDSRLIALAPALEYQQVQQAIDGSQLQLAEDARRRIAAALGVPMSIAGAWDSATYQSAPEQKRFYYESVIFRECERHARVMNEVVMPFFDKSGAYEFYYDTDAVASLLEDKATKAAMVNTRLSGGSITINQAREAMGDEPLPGGDVLLIPSGYTLVPVSQLAQTAQQQAAAVQPPAPLETPAAPATNSVAVPETGGKSVCLMLKLGAQPDLLALQSRVKQLLADSEVTWNEPDSFHITLIYAPSVTDEQLAALTAALQSAELPDMKLKVGSLRTFDNLGEYAVHFQIRRNADLLDLQETLYDVFASAGVGLSAYSDPAAYKPRITVGYSKSKPRAVVFEGKLTVTPVGMELAAGDEVVWQTSGAPDEPPPAAPADTPTALDELDAWQKKTRNKSAAAPFKNYLIRDEVADAIRYGLQEAAGDKDAVKAVFDRARAVLSVKAIQATRLDFEDAFDDLMSAAMSGRVTRRAWSTRSRSLVSVGCNKAYRDGLVDGGVDDEPDDSELETIAAHIRAQSEYITSLGAVLFSDDDTVSQAMADQKAAMWFAKSVMPMYQAGKLSADGNGLYEWTVGATEHCADCKRLDGQRHRLKDFHRRNLIPQSDLLECGGFNCRCSLVKVSGRARGGW